MLRLPRFLPRGGLRIGHSPRPLLASRPVHCVHHAANSRHSAQPSGAQKLHNQRRAPSPSPNSHAHRPLAEHEPRPPRGGLKRVIMLKQLRTAARKSVNPAGAFQYMDDLRTARYQPNVQAFNDLILACGRMHAVARAFKLYSDMKKRGIKPNDETFNFLFNVCAEGRGEGSYLERAQWLKTSEMPRHEIPMRLPLYNVFLKCVVNHSKQMDLLMRTIEEMKSRGIQPDVSTYTVLIRAFGSKGDLDTIDRLFTELRAEGVEPDLVLYNQIMVAFGRHDPPRALELFTQMMEKGPDPDIRTLDILVHAALGSPHAPKIITRVLDVLTEPTLRIRPDIVVGILLTLPDFITSLFHTVANLESGLEHIETALRMVRRYRIPYSAAYFNTLIAAYSKLGAHDKALSTFESMQLHSFRPDSRAYMGLLVSCRKQNNPDRAFELYMQMVDRNVVRDELIIRTLKQIFGKRKDLLAKVEAVEAPRKALQQDKEAPKAAPVPASVQV